MENLLDNPLHPYQPHQPYSSPRQLLPLALWIDCIISGACGLLQVAATQAVHQLTALGVSLLTGTGWFMMAYGVFLCFLARHPHPPSGLVWFLVLGNPVWGIASALLLSQQHATLTSVGVAYLFVNAVFGFSIALLQYLGLQQRGSHAA